MNNPDILSGTPRRDPPKVFFANYYLRQYRIILSADTASEVRQMLSQKRR
jgi:hypothetical protein